MPAAVRLRSTALALLAILAMPGPARAQTMDCPGTIKSWVLSGYYKSGDCYCSGGKPVCSGGKSGKKKGGLSPQATAKLTLLQGLFDGIADGMVTKPQAMKTQKAVAPVVHVSKSPSPQVDTEARQFESGKNSLLTGLKGLDTSAGGSTPEAMAAAARKPFDTGMDVKMPEAAQGGAATPFFGDSLPPEQWRTLIEPENDSRVVDLRKARTFLVERMRADESKPGAKQGKSKHSDGTAPGEALYTAPSCTELSGKLSALREQRARFRKTVDLAHDELETWQGANRAALINAAKEGVEQYVGDLLETLAKRGEAADRLRGIYQANADKMAAQGIPVADIQARIRKLEQISGSGQVAESLSSISEWQGFIKNGASALLAKLSKSNAEVRQMLEDPRLQPYFESEAPAVQAMLDLTKIAAANRVFGKWVARQMPVVGAVEYGINQSYNALDWALSLNRIIQAREVNGRVQEAARSLQARIDQTAIALKSCR